MITPSTQCHAGESPRRIHRGRRARLGFTLVELLVAIGVIAILAGILVPAIFSVLNTSREAAITMEVKDLDRAIEQFQIDHKFYPPTIGNNPNAEINSPADMFRYLARYSPNHAEGTVFPGEAVSRVEHWWNEVGQFMDERSSLVFWLSGICKSTQYPLTGYSTPTGVMAPHGANEFVDGTPVPVTIERVAAFDFKANRLVRFDPALSIVGYEQPFGSDGDVTYRYYDYKSYAPGFAYQNNAGFINPEGFQLFGPGMDGVTQPASNVLATPFPFENDDNIANFAEGRIDKYIINNQ